MELILNNDEIILDYRKAIFHPSSDSLIIADLHLGKTTHFRKYGIPIPVGVAHKDLHQLSELLDHYQPQQIVIAGDFFHASANSEIKLFIEWYRKHSNTKVVLVKGNHDRLNVLAYSTMNVQVVSEPLKLGNFEISHFPKDSSNYFTICGHIHPGAKLQLNKRQRIRLPSFLVQKNQLILPAFSNFTGLDTSLQHTGDNYVIANHTVIKM